MYTTIQVAHGSSTGGLSNPYIAPQKMSATIIHETSACTFTTGLHSNEGAYRLFHARMDVVPILKLQLEHIGNIFFIFLDPPLLSGMSWPQWNWNTEITFVHHFIEHLEENIGPQWWSHTCWRSAAENPPIVYT